MVEANPVSRAGYGKPGYCKVCSFSEVDAINDRLQKGWNARQVNDFAKQFGVRFNRQTIYAHKAHATDPRDKVIAYAERTKAVAPIRTGTTDQFLEAVRDIGLRRIEQTPDEVTLDHALKAATILSQKKEKQTNVFLMLAKVVTGNTGEIIVGQAEEIEHE